jgi:hypothetical protein
MESAFKKLTAVLAVALVAVVLTAAANAACGDASKPGASLQPQSWQKGMGVGSASLLQVSENADAIVGFWQVTLTAEGNPGPPDGTVIDKGFSQFHSDGTEILNSSRPPVTQSFCLGVWKKVSPGHYKLNHFPISWDQNSNFVGVANLREDIVLSRDGNSFTGTFTIDQYDQSGNTLAHLVGVVSATRITVDTPASSVL